MTSISRFIFLAILIETTPAYIDSNCDFFQEVQLGQEYFIYNTEYPRNYSSSRNCRWSARSPVGTVIVLSCNDVALPYSSNCQGDKLSLSPTGDESFSDAENYCGRTTFTTYSYGNQLAVGLFPTPGSPGGTFLCSLAAMRPGPPTCDCGYKPQMRIVGGQDTGTNEFPSMAGLVDLSRESVFCGASIIAPMYAVTASHCLLHQTSSNLGLLVGARDLNSIAESAQLLPISTFVQHPSYDSTTQQNDIAVVKTQFKIVYSMAVSPICLPFLYREYNFAYDTVTALGWGFKDISGDKADTLQKVDLEVVSNQDCDAALAEDVQVTQMCTYGDGKDSCISDSGGPLVWQDGYSRKLELVGVISYGLGCATNKPAVNTRVTSFLSWIASVTSDAQFCIR